MSDRCEFCNLEMRPKNFASDRACAWKPDGTWSDHNWNCGLMNRIREHLPGYGEGDYKGWAYRDDMGAGSFGVLHIGEGPEGPWGDDARPGYLILTYYKDRGATDTCAYVDGSDNITRDEAVKVLKYLDWLEEQE
jgi:hypothetical protein